ncbi:MAG: YbaB/EbfC family nucleoid-associated protein [Pirellulales bacterium]|nr:YbaB/EbfC family nucleoid-associated protein [Pirellulales bacterium]
MTIAANDAEEINVFKGLANLGSLVQHAREIGAKMQGLAGELRGRRVTGTAGGGMVEVEVNGLMEVLRCRIDEQLVAQGDCELLEDLVASAVNQAIAKGKQLHADTMRSMTGGMELPGLEQALGQFFQAGDEEENDEEAKPS